MEAWPIVHGTKSQPDIAVTVTSILGRTPLVVRPTRSPDAFYATLPDREVVVKVPFWCNDAGSALLEEWIYRTCHARGIRTPEIVGVSTDPECLILERLPGESLGTGHKLRADRRAWARAGEDLRALHKIRIDGFGPLAKSSQGVRGAADSWCPFVDYTRSTGIRWLVDDGYLTSSVASALERRYDEADQLIRERQDGRLLHGDIDCHHLFAEPDGRYTGMIDFGQAQAGDPHWDLARMAFWDGERALDDLLAGYGRDRVAREDYDLLHPLYRLAFATHHAAESRDEPEHIRLLLSRAGIEL